MKTVKTFLVGALVALVGFTASAQYTKTADLTLCKGDVLEIYEDHGSSYTLTATSDKTTVATATKAANSVTSGKFFTVEAVGTGTAKVTLKSEKGSSYSKTTDTLTLNLTVNAERTVKVNGTANVTGWANDGEPGNSTWTSSVSPNGAVEVSLTQQSTSAVAATLTGKTASDAATVTLSNLKNSTSGFKYIYKVKVTSDDSSVLTRTVFEDGNWTDASWMNKKTGAGGQAWKAGSDAEITVAGTVTLDVGTGAVSAGKVTIKGSGDLTLRNYQNMTASSIDYSALDGTVTFEYVSDSADKAVDSKLISAIKAQTDRKVKYAFSGTTAANGWNFGSWDKTVIKTHIVIGEGTHTWSQNNNGVSGGKFGENGTDENPTLLVKSGATLNFTGKDLSGYQNEFVAGGVIRVNAGGTLNFKQPSGKNPNMNYRQRLVLDPGSVTTFAYGTDKFVLHGAGSSPGTATASTANVYVPESDGTAEPAILRCASPDGIGLNINNTSNSRGGGCAIWVGANSKLLLDSKVSKGEESDSTSNKRILAKLGPGELEITGEVTSSVDFDARAGIITLPAEQGQFNKSFTATADVTYRFPAGWAEGVKYTLGSGTVTGTAPDEGTATVYVGTTKEEGCDLVYEGKTVRYGLNVPRTPIAVPTPAQNLVYGWTNQVGVAEGEGYVLTGVVVTNAVGTFSAFATPDDTHCWTDKSRDTKEITWSIAYRAATVTVIDTNKVSGAAEPIYRTRNENFIADDPTELVWTAWRTNTSEEVGTYDVVVLGETHQGGYEITYVGGTLEITPEPPPTITIHIEQGEEITDVMDENGESVPDEDLELPAGTTEVTLELEASGLTVPVFKVVRDNVTNVTTMVATYTIKDNDTLEFFAEEAEEDDPTVTPEQRKQAIIDAIDPPIPGDEEDEKRYTDAKAKVEAVVGEEADQVPAKDFAAYITKNPNISSADIAESDYVAASVKLDTDDLITEETEVEFAELVKVEGDALTFTVDIDSDPVNVEAIKDMVEASSDLTAWKDHILEVEATFEPGGEDEAGKVTITPVNPTDKAFMRVVIPQDPGTK